MQSLSQLSRRYLRRQWKRTLFTGLGIIMATALFAGVALLFTSLQDTFITSEIESGGGWHYQVTGLTAGQAEQLQANIRISESEQIAVSALYGRIAADDPAQDDQWLMLRDAAGLTGLSPYQASLIQGRLPQNENEIALDSLSMSKFADAAVGGTLTLALNTYRAAADGQTTPDTARTYRIVGLFSWFDSGLPYDTYQALTIVPPVEQAGAEVYLTVKGGRNFENRLFSALADVLPGDALLSNRETVKYGEVVNGRLHVRTHDGLLRYMGQSSFDDTNNQLMTFFGFLTAIIMVSVVFVIRNSLSMSVNERIGEFGLLRVVGGSPAQIRRLVLQDALQLALVSIPVGLLAGLVAMKITLSVVSGVDLPIIKNLKLVVSPWPLLLAAILSLLAILVAALSPAVRAGRLSPVEAVRRSDAYRIQPGRSGSLRRKGWLSRRFFGPAGILASRSVRRDRRRFRNTVLSVGVSAVLFLAAGGISFQMQHQLARFNSEQTDFTLQAYTGAFDLDQEILQANSLIAGHQAIERLALYSRLSMPIQADGNLFSDELVETYRKALSMNGEERTAAEIRLELADPETTPYGTCTVLLADQALLAELGLADPGSAWSDLQQGRAILSQTGSLSLNGLGGATVSVTRLKAGDVFPLENLITTDGQGQERTAITVPPSITISETLAELPWFQAGAFSSMPQITLILSRSFVQSHFQLASDFKPMIEDRLAIDARPGQEADLQQVLLGLVPEGEAAVNNPDSLQLSDQYEQLINNRNMIFVFNVFLYGFAAVIILICAMNILNTVTTNIVLRRRELAMLQAVGMSRVQLGRMLFLECTLYGLTGAFWGSLIGLGLLALLSQNANELVSGSILAQLPWNLIVITLAGALIISIAAGLLPVRRVLRDNIVDAIRAEE